ncbi:hypothetical protein ON010_g18519 [Phytophthora cinnamomi]|nr:hypothetical protein ON010_g18519 [Phytophthora cinnamomi]
MLVHNAKIKIQEEYTRKEKEREINKRITFLLHCYLLGQRALGGDRRVAATEDDRARRAAQDADRGGPGPAAELHDGRRQEQGAAARPDRAGPDQALRAGGGGRCARQGRAPRRGCAQGGHGQVHRNRQEGGQRGREQGQGLAQQGGGRHAARLEGRRHRAVRQAGQDRVRQHAGHASGPDLLRP